MICSLAIFLAHMDFTVALPYPSRKIDHQTLKAATDRNVWEQDTKTGNKMAMLVAYFLKYIVM